jgi:hypothetical protein
MCAPPLADASLDRRLRNAYKSTRRGEALRTRGAPKTSGLWSTHPQVLLSPWKSQGFKEEIVTTIG